MDIKIRNLGILLVVQLLLAVMLSSSGPNLAAMRPDIPLLDFAMDFTKEVDHLLIEGGEGKSVALHKQGEDWILPDHFNFSASTSKVDAMLARLKGLEYGMPVATTVGALKRFKVSADLFERRITLKKGDEELAQVLLGTSPGVRRVHARVEDDEAVYSVDFAVHEVPVQVAEWEEKNILQIPELEMETIQVADLSLIRQVVTAPSDSTAPVTEMPEVPELPEVTKIGTPSWHATGLQAEESLKHDAVEKLFKTVANLRIKKVLGLTQEERYGLKTPKLRFSVTRKGQDAIEYQLGEQEGGEAFVVKVSTRPEYFEIAKYMGNSLVEGAARDALVQKPKEATVEPSVVEQPVVEQPVVEQPVVEQPVVEQPVVEQPVVEQPVVE